MDNVTGVRPEIVLRALISEEVYCLYRPLVVGKGVIVPEAIELMSRSLKLHLMKAAANL